MGECGWLQGLEKRYKLMQSFGRLTQTINILANHGLIIEKGPFNPLKRVRTGGQVID